MDIAIFNYQIGEVDIIRGIEQDLIEAKYEGDILEYLEDCGYNRDNIEWMCSDEIKVNEIEIENT